MSNKFDKNAERVKALLNRNPMYKGFINICRAEDQPQLMSSYKNKPYQ